MSGPGPSDGGIALLMLQFRVTLSGVSSNAFMGHAQLAQEDFRVCAPQHRKCCQHPRFDTCLGDYGDRSRRVPHRPAGKRVEYMRKANPVLQQIASRIAAGGDATFVQVLG